MPTPIARAIAWLAFALAALLHAAFWSGVPLTGPMLGGLVAAFALAAAALMAVILRVQRGAPGPSALPAAAKWVLGLGFVYVALHLVDWLPVGGSGRGGVEPQAFERAFSAVLAWQALAAACYHTFMKEAA